MTLLTMLSRLRTNNPKGLGATLTVHRIFRPTFCDDRETPLMRTEDPRIRARDLPVVTRMRVCDTLARRANQLVLRGVAVTEMSMGWPVPLRGAAMATPRAGRANAVRRHEELHGHAANQMQTAPAMPGPLRSNRYGCRSVAGDDRRWRFVEVEIYLRAHDVRPVVECGRSRGKRYAAADDAVRLNNRAATQVDVQILESEGDIVQRHPLKADARRPTGSDHRIIQSEALRGIVDEELRVAMGDLADRDAARPVEQQVPGRPASPDPSRR